MRTAYIQAVVAILGGLLAEESALAAGPPSIAAVRNSASYSSVIAPGTLISIFGDGLSADTLVADRLPLPTKLAGTTAKAGSVELPLHYVSPKQINALLPLGIPTRETTVEGRRAEVVDITVTTQAGTSAPAMVVLSALAPGLYSRDGTGTGPVLALTPEFRLSNAVNPGDTIVFYATGLGPADASGRCARPPRLRIGTRLVDVLWAGLSQFPGVYQINASVPQELLSDEIFAVSPVGVAPLTEYVQPLELPLTPSPNVADVTGSLEITYPAPGKVCTFSPLPYAGRFGVSFLIRRDARPFSVLVKVRGWTEDIDAAALLRFDPPSGKATALLKVPTMEERMGDFSNSVFRPTADFLAGGAPFPRDIIPASRLDRDLLSALAFVPLPNIAPRPGQEYWRFRAEIDAPAGERFSTEEDNWSLKAFASFWSIGKLPAGYQIDRVFVLHVDGRPVASAPVTWKTP